MHITKTNPNTLNLEIFMGKFYIILGKDGHYSQQALKHVQQVHQFSIHITNNVTNIPHYNLGCYPTKTHSHLKPKTNPYTL